MGAAQLGYGDGDEGPSSATAATPTPSTSPPTSGTASPSRTPSCSGELTLALLRDDGAVAYLNGVEVLRTNLPSGALDFRTLADDNSPDETQYLAGHPQRGGQSGADPARNERPRGRGASVFAVELGRRLRRGAGGRAGADADAAPAPDGHTSIRGWQLRALVRGAIAVARRHQLVVTHPRSAATEPRADRADPARRRRGRPRRRREGALLRVDRRGPAHRRLSPTRSARRSALPRRRHRPAHRSARPGRRRQGAHGHRPARRAVERRRRLRVVLPRRQLRRLQRRPSATASPIATPTSARRSSTPAIPTGSPVVDAMTLDGADGVPGLRELLTTELRPRPRLRRRLPRHDRHRGAQPLHARRERSTRASSSGPRPGFVRLRPAAARGVPGQGRSAEPRRCSSSTRATRTTSSRPRGAIDFVLFESYRLDSSSEDLWNPYSYPDNRYNVAPKLMAEADRGRRLPGAVARLRRGARRR